MKICPVVSAIFVSTAILAASSVSAAKLLEEGGSDGAERIRLANKLPTLTQQVAAASCAVTSNVDVEMAHASLAKATADFDAFIVALRDGDAMYDIKAPEIDRKLLRDIADVQQEWDAIHGAVDAVLADGSDVDSAHYIDDHNLALLEATSILAADVTGTHARPFELAFSDAILIKVAGQQRMLTQKIAKDACEIWTGYNAEAGRVDLEVTMSKFEATLNALRHGLPELSIEAAPNDIIAADLDGLIARWSDVRPPLQTLLDGGTIDESQKEQIYHAMMEEMTDLETLLVHYQEHAERRH